MRSVAGPRSRLSTAHWEIMRIPGAGKCYANEIMISMNSTNHAFGSVRVRGFEVGKPFSDTFISLLPAEYLELFDLAVCLDI